MTVRELLQLLFDMDANSGAEVVFMIDGQPLDVEIVDQSQTPALVWLKRA